MTTLLRALMDVGGLFVLSWTCIFGGIGGLLAHVRGRPVREGVAFGVLLGPFGWAMVWLRSEDSGAQPGAGPETLDDWSKL